MLCPRCVDVPLLPRRGALSEDVCRCCGGRFLERAVLADLCARVLGVDEGALLALSASRGRAPCAACRARTSPVTLKGAPVWLCGGCGGAFFEPGALTTATLGLVDEVLPGPAATSHHRPAKPQPTRAAASLVGAFLVAALGTGLAALIVVDERRRDAPQTCPAGLRVFQRTTGDGGEERLCLDARGAQEGPYTVDDAAGTPRVRGAYVGGRRDGSWSFFDARGRLRAHGSYDAAEALQRDAALPTAGGDVRIGWWRRFHSDGRVREEGAYLHDRRAGEWRFIDDYGVDRLTGSFVDGAPVGTFSFWVGGKETLGPLPASFFVDEP